MTKRVIIKYLLLSFSLIGIAFFLAFQFSWLYDNGGRNSRKQMVVFFLPIAIGWFGCIYLGMLICRFFMVNSTLKDKFLHILELDKHTMEQLDPRFKLWPIISFPIFFFLIAGFFLFINNYKKEQLAKFGVVKIFKIDSVSFYKGARRVHVNYKFKNDNLTYIFTVQDSLKKNDTISIILSTKNPNILTLKSEYSLLNSN